MSDHPQSPQHSDDRLALLIDAYLHGELSSEGLAELESRLREDSDAAARFITITEQAGMMREVFGSATDQLEAVEDPDTDDFMSILSELDTSEAAAPIDLTAEVARREMEEKEQERERKRFLQQARDGFQTQQHRQIVIPRAALWLGLAAMIALAAGLVVYFGQPAGSHYASGLGETAQSDDNEMPVVTNVAFIRSDVDADWSAQSAPTQGYLRNNTVVTLNGGLAEIVFGDGVAVIVQGPAIFEPIGPNAMRLVSGRITATVPRTATRFTVSTPNGLTIERGREFGVIANADGQVVAQAFAGGIHLTSAGGEHAQLRAGEAAIAEAHGTVREARPNELAFVGNEEFDALRKSENSAYHRWLAHSYSLRRDSSVVAYYVFDSDDAGANTLLNRALPGEVTDGQLGDGDQFVAPHWVEGRFAETQALRFGTAGADRAFGVVVPDHHSLDLDREMTFAAWVRVTRPQAADSTILSKREVPISRLNYQFALMGEWRTAGRELQFGAGRDDRSLEAFSYSFASERVRLNEWMHLAVTTDGRINRFYIDGEMVGVSQQSIPATTNNAPLIIGATPPGIHADIAGGMTPFGGDISEVLIAGRAFAGDEIRLMYQNGIPAN